MAIEIRALDFVPAIGRTVDFVTEEGRVEGKIIDVLDLMENVVLVTIESYNWKDEKVTLEAYEVDQFTRMGFK